MAFHGKISNRLVGVFSAGLTILSLYFFYSRKKHQFDESYENTTIVSCDYQIEREFSGQIREIWTKENGMYLGRNYFKVIIEDEIDPTRNISYLYDRPRNDDFIEQIFVGQKIWKITGEDICHLINQNGESVEYSVPYCDRIENYP